MTDQEYSQNVKAATVHPDGTISVIWWLRDIEGNWQFWRNVIYTKVKEEKGA